MAGTVDTSAKHISPLKLISLLVGTCEVSFVTAATQTSGNIQLLFAISAVAGIALVTLAFFVFLWYRPHTLLAPPEFKTADEMIAVIAALRRTTDNAAQQVDAITRNAQGVYASSEELRTLAERTKISWDAIHELESQLAQQAKDTKNQIEQAKAFAMFVAG